MAKQNLLASAPTLTAILDSIERFYCGERKELVPAADGAWSVVSPMSRKIIPGVRVVRAKGRYRFEAV